MRTKNRHVVIILLAFLASLALGQWTVEIEPYLTSDDCYLVMPACGYGFGTDSASHVGHDINDHSMPPPPPDPAYHSAAWVNDSLGVGADWCWDIRSTTPDTIYWELRFFYRGMGEIEEFGIRWDPDDLPTDGDFRLGMNIDTLDWPLFKTSDQKPHFNIDWNEAVRMRETSEVHYTFLNMLTGHPVFRYIKSPSNVDEAPAKPMANQLAASPNPFNSAVEIEVPEGQMLSIYNSNGRLVDKFSRHDGNIIWQPSTTLESGIYIARTSGVAEQVFWPLP